MKAATIVPAPDTSLGGTMTRATSWRKAIQGGQGHTIYTYNEQGDVISKRVIQAGVANRPTSLATNTMDSETGHRRRGAR